MPAGKGVKLIDMIAVSWQFWLWMWSSCIEQDSVSNNNSSNNRAELWNYVTVLKEEEILYKKKWEAESYRMHGIGNDRGCRGHKGNSVQLSAWRTIWANYSLCFCEKVFPYLARECVHVWRRLSEPFSQALQSAGKRREMCKGWMRAGVNLLGTPEALEQVLRSWLHFVWLQSNSSLVALCATQEQARDWSLTPD